MTTKTTEILAERLRTARLNMVPEVSQRDIAKLLERSPSAVNLWEKGKTEPDADDLVQLAKRYRVTTDWLLGVSDTPRHIVPAAFMTTVPIASDDDIVRGNWNPTDAPRLQTERAYPEGVAITVHSEALSSVAPTGSRAVITPAPSVAPGSIIAAIIESGALVLRRVVQDGGVTLLVGDDHRYPSYTLDNTVRVVGVLREVHRVTLM